MIRQPKRSTRGSWAWIVIALVVLIISGLVAHGGKLFGWETNVFYHLYNWPPVLQMPALVLTQFGSTWLIVGLTLFFYVKHRSQLALLVLLTGLITFVSAEFLKRLVHRPRPFDLLAGIVSREWSASGYGFPSGHTAVATAVAVILWAHVPRRWQFLLPIGVGVIALTRIYLGVHAPLDIVGGAVLGLTVGLIMNKYGSQLLRKLGL